ncbi:hypothetical protein [Haloferula sp. A504]|uniref:hypothetical protein n=1 Tax=Haloferula sp. A504 TaxID=3373601 RepID=UPI0031CB548E|nr:hypothetical protein [Verrucomicrobiaceae bacterium E54]
MTHDPRDKHEDPRLNLDPSDDPWGSLAPDNEDFARSSEDGWFYSDDDTGIDSIPSDAEHF